MKKYKLMMICAAAALSALAAAPAVSYAAEEEVQSASAASEPEEAASEPADEDTDEPSEDKEHGESVAKEDGNVSEKDGDTVTTGTMRPFEDYVWETDDKGRYYCYLDEEMLTGVQNIAGQDYLFSDKGVLKTGWRTINGRRYYFSQMTGQPVYGWIDYDDKKYYIDREHGKAYGAFITESGNGYYFNPDYGYLDTSDEFVKQDGDIYCVDYEGSLVGGLVTFDGKLYMFDEDNYKQKTGFQIYNGQTYYYYPENGELAQDFFRVGSKWYYAHPTDGVLLGEFDVDGKHYVTDDNCVIVTGWQNSEKGISYLKEDTLEFAVGVTDIEDKKYVFSNDGILLTGRVKYGDKKYYVGEDGSVQTGFIDLEDGKYYFGEDGAMVTGWKVIEENKYYFDENGKMATGRLIIEGNKYYISDEGIVQTGFQDLADGRYYFNENGVMQTGLQTVDGKVYYFDENGRMKTNYSTAGYRFNTDGVGTLLSDVQKKADTILASAGKTATAIYNYVVTHNRYDHMEATRTPAQIELAGWKYFANYAMNNTKIVCYYFAAITDLLFQQANIESRIVYGNGRGTGDHYWNQIKVDGAWTNYDTCNGFAGVTDAYLKTPSTRTGDGYVIYDYIYPNFS